MSNRAHKKKDVLKGSNVLLVTLTGGANYGNRLQHFALKTAIEKQGYAVVSLNVRGNPESSAKLHIKEAALSTAKMLGIHRLRSKLARMKRRDKLSAFDRTHMGTILYIPVDQVRRTNWQAYHCAVTGSDQVWHNWHWKNVPDELSYFYLDFMPVDKRVSYAPSFGFTAFPHEDIETHRRGLMDMCALSCREQEGCELIEQLTGRKAQKVLDPTLLLTADEWKQLEEKPKHSVPERYMIQFFLGKVSEEYADEMSRISLEQKIPIINLQDSNDPENYGLSPSEFIWMIHHADTVCTDSFHASVFSILFERNLRVFERISPQHGNMFGRLHDLLEPLGLMGNVYGVDKSMSTALSEPAKRYLENERRFSNEYLRNSLAGKRTE